MALCHCLMSQVSPPLLGSWYVRVQCFLSQSMIISLLWLCGFLGAIYHVAMCLFAAVFLCWSDLTTEFSFISEKWASCSEVVWRGLLLGVCRHIHGSWVWLFYLCFQPLFLVMRRGEIASSFSPGDTCATSLSFSTLPVGTIFFTGSTWRVESVQSGTVFLIFTLLQLPQQSQYFPILPHCDCHWWTEFPLIGEGPVHHTSGMLHSLCTQSWFSVMNAYTFGVLLLTTNDSSILQLDKRLAHLRVSGAHLLSTCISAYLAWTCSPLSA